MDKSATDWSSLPDCLLSSIVKHLHRKIDILRFRAVCNSFRSSVPPPPKLLSPRTDLKISIPPLGRRGHLVLAEFTIYAIEPLTKISDPQPKADTWLVKIEELNSGKIRLEDPLSRVRLGNLCNKIPEFEKLPESLSLLDYRVKEVAKTYRLELVAQGKGINRTKPVIYTKAVICDETEDGFAVLAIIQGGDQLGVWRNVDKKWSIIDMGYDSFVDVIYHNNKFYGLMSTGLTITVDPKSLVVDEVARPPENWHLGARDLIQSLNDLFLIVKQWVWKLQPTDFKIYKLDEEKCEWVEVVEGLEDRVFFLCSDGSFSLSAKEFTGCKGNCVYFKHDFFKIDGYHPGANGGIFDLKDGIVDRLSAFPGYSNVFWPPPTWLK